jgi:ribosomal protein S12 methylthiotransferase accessory factor
MTGLKRTKPYKASDPMTTIAQVRDILHRHGVFTTERSVEKHAAGLYSCRISLSDEAMWDLDEGTNGKGMKPSYAMASGYAELLERIQCSGTFLPTRQSWALKRFVDSHKVTDSYRKRLLDEQLVLDYLYGPDERWLSAQEVVRESFGPLSATFRLSGQEELSAFVSRLLGADMTPCAPFYHVRSARVEYLPIDLIFHTCLTNGMCAGNTPQEALIQGICEVFERYAIRRIYLDELTPPTIPLELYEGTEIYDKILQLTQNGDKHIVIKDCSLGLGLPVIGALVIDRPKNRYTFCLGADPSPITSLERCLTEIHQGDPVSNLNKFHHLHPSHDPFERIAGTVREKAKATHYFRTVADGTGLWPTSIFSDTASYPFDGFHQHTSISDQEDLRFVVDKVHELGYELYVRDNSFLGFPAYTIYVPGMSETDYIFDQEALPARNELTRNLPALFNLKRASKDALRDLASSLERYSAVRAYPIPPLHRFFPYHTHEDVQSLDKDLLLVMIFIKLGELDKAFDCIDRYLRDQPEASRQENLYYYCTRDCLRLKALSAEDHALEQLTAYYGADLAAEVIGDLSDSDNIFRNIRLPTCFDCASCEVTDTCRLFDVLRVLRALKQCQSNHPIDQSWLSGIFKNDQ